MQTRRELGVPPTASFDSLPNTGLFAADDRPTAMPIRTARCSVVDARLTVWTISGGCSHCALGVFFVRGGPAEIG
jgi:hypothetical protein